MKLAVLGLGFMGRTHLQALRKIPRAEVVAVASDNRVALTGDLSGTHGNLGGSGEKFDFSGVHTYSHWAQAVQDPLTEAVDICLPTHLHAEAAIAALNAGKHVLVEKPLALDGSEADRILAAQSASGKLLMAAQVLRFFPVYVPLIRLARSGGLGPMRMAVFRRRCAFPGWGGWLGDPAKSGGAVIDLLIHDIDMMLHLFGTPGTVSASGHENLAKGVDLITAQCSYPDGGTTIVTGGWHHPGAYPFSMEYTVSFDGGTIEYSSNGRPPTLYRAGESKRALEMPATDGYQAEIEYFVDCAATGRVPERCPPEESVAAVKLARLLIEARKQTGGIIPCRL